MKSAFRLFTLGLGLIFCATVIDAQVSNFSTLDDPSAGTGLGQGTWAYGVSGNNIVGYYGNSDGGRHGFLYNGSIFTTLDFPSVANFTEAFGIDGVNVVGGVYPNGYNPPQEGFLYHGSSWTTIIHPSSNAYTYTFANAISGNTIVGYYLANFSVTHAFLYNVTNSSFSALDDPLAGSGGNQDTYAYGISGSNIVGGYRASDNSEHGFLYNGTSFTTIDVPNAVNSRATGISGSNIVGYYTDTQGANHGFLYTGGTYTTIDDQLGLGGTWVNGISGNNIVGQYYDGSGVAHGFIAQAVPEPSSWLMMFLCGLGMAATVQNYFRSRRE